MRSGTTTFITFFLLVLWVAAGAQVTLTADNSTPPAGYTDSLYFGVTAGVGMPIGGASQVWDYSDVDLSFPRTVIIDDEQGNSFFSEAYTSGPGSLNFQIFEADAVYYEGADEEGVYTIGRVVTETSLPLTLVTGNPDDTFLFVGDTVAYEGRINQLQFPMTYQDTYGGTRIERTNIELTVAAFGLTDAPVEGRRYHTENRTVIGYGQVIIPLEDQSPSPPIDVLLVQVDRSVVDSFFLAGAIAPPALTAAFGVSQGMTSSNQTFLFLTPGLEAPVVRMNYTGTGDLIDFIYRSRAADLVSANRELSPLQFSVGPNPVRLGEQLRIQMDQETALQGLHLLNQQGQLVSMLSIQNAGGGQYVLRVPEHLTAGMYFLQAYDDEGRLIRAQKIAVQ